MGQKIIGDILKKFQAVKNILFRPRLKPEDSFFLTDQIIQGSDKVIPYIQARNRQEQEIDVNALLDNGETPVTHALKTLEKRLDRHKKDEAGEKPRDLYKGYEEDLDFYQRKNNAGRKGQELVTTLNEYGRELKNMPKAALFIDQANDPKMQEQVSWLQDYQPDEESFLNLFDPEWKLREQARERLSRLKKQEEDNGDGGIGGRGRERESSFSASPGQDAEQQEKDRLTPPLKEVFSFQDACKEKERILQKEHLKENFQQKTHERGRGGYSMGR